MKRINLLRRRIELVEALTEVHGKAVFGTTKTHQRRSVPIPRFLADELAAQVAGKGPEDLVFTTPGGGVLRNTNFRPRHFDPAAALAGLPGLTPHELRHTAASLAVAAGANVKAVQQMLGHASADDAGRLCGSVRRRSGRSRGPAVRGVRGAGCGPGADRL